MLLIRKMNLDVQEEVAGKRLFNTTRTYIVLRKLFLGLYLITKLPFTEGTEKPVNMHRDI